MIKIFQNFEGLEKNERPREQAADAPRNVVRRDDARKEEHRRASVLELRKSHKLELLLGCRSRTPKLPSIAGLPKHH